MLKPSSSASTTRFKLGLAGALALAAGDASAYWRRDEWVGVEFRTGSQRARLIDLSLYESRWGLGAGTTVLDMGMGAWDVPRPGLPDASGHGLMLLFPLKAYAALASWKGPPYFHFLDGSEAEHSVGKLELFYSYCDWATMFDFTEVTSGALPGQVGRAYTGERAKVKIVDYGLRFDQVLTKSASMTASVGRQEMTVKPSLTYREKKFERWYGSVSYYFGATHGTDYRGGIYRPLVDVWDAMRALFGGSTVHREPLKSTNP